MGYKSPISDIASSTKEIKRFESPSCTTTLVNMLNLGSIPLARYEHQTPLPILILQTTVILGLGYISLSTIFNLVFHPLANVPGPFWARCSNLWGRYQNLHGQKAHSIHAAHKRYGKLASPRSHGDAKFSRVSCEDCSQYVVLFESFFCA